LPSARLGAQATAQLARWVFPEAFMQSNSGGSDKTEQWLAVIGMVVLRERNIQLFYF